MRLTSFLLLLSLSLTFTAAEASAQEGKVPYIETLEVRVHSIDVIVTDAKGSPVNGLDRNDFEVLVDGRPQAVSNFSSFTPVDTTGSTVPPPSPGALSPGTPRDEVQTAARPPLKVIFYLDELSMNQATQKRLRSELNRLLDQMAEGDEAMLLRPSEEKKLAMPFTADREAVRAALDEAIRNEGHRATAPIAREMRLYEIEMRAAAGRRQTRLAARRWAGIVRARVQQRLGQLRAAVNAAAEIEGRKVLVLVTESLPAEPGKEAFGGVADPIEAEGADPLGSLSDWNVSDLAAVDWVDLTPLLNEIGRTAATHGVTIYSIQSEYGLGLLTPGGDIGARAPVRTKASQPMISSAVPSELVSRMIDNTGASLRILADATGGKSYVGAGRIDDMVRGITGDVRNYYSIGFRADEAIDQPQRIEVRVRKRPELRVRARREVIRKSPEQQMTDRVIASLFQSKPVSDEIPVRIETKVVGAAADRSYKTYWVAVHVPMSALTFLPEGDVYKASFSVHYAAMGEDADFMSGIAGTEVIEVPSAQFEESRTQKYTYVVPMNFRPAKHTIAVGVLDSISHLSGSEKIELSVN